MTITPELAPEWLDRGRTNGKITRCRIEATTAAIKRGEWQLTGEAIKLDDDGRGRDGQNRLHATVEAGIPAQSVVARGLSEDAFDAMGHRPLAQRGRRAALPARAGLGHVAMAEPAIERGVQTAGRGATRNANRLGRE